MSILIKGMEMPKENDYTIAIVYGDGVVTEYHEDYWIRGADGEKQLGTAVPVPPHGRLVDADAEVEVWDVCGRQGVFPHFTTTVSKFLLCHLVGKIPPTIIEAEEGE